MVGVLDRALGGGGILVACKFVHTQSYHFHNISPLKGSEVVVHIPVFVIL